MRSVFVGHPAIERAKRMTGGEDFRARHGIAKDARLLALLPGSRTNEIRFIFPVFREAVTLLAARVKGLVTVLPTVPHVAARVREGAADWPTSLHIVEGEDEKFAAFDAADAALAASGTVTTELALSGTPMVVGYKLGWLTYGLMRPLIHAKFATIVNLLLDREAVPELIQSSCTPRALADAVETLLTDKNAAARQTADLKEAMKLLGRAPKPPPSAPPGRYSISCAYRASSASPFLPPRSGGSVSRGASRARRRGRGQPSFVRLFPDRIRRPGRREPVEPSDQLVSRALVIALGPGEAHRRHLRFPLQQPFIEAHQHVERARVLPTDVGPIRPRFAFLQLRKLALQRAAHPAHGGLPRFGAGIEGDGVREQGRVSRFVRTESGRELRHRFALLGIYPIWVFDLVGSRGPEL